MGEYCVNPRVKVKKKKTEKKNEFHTNIIYYVGQTRSLEHVELVRFRYISISDLKNAAESSKNPVFNYQLLAEKFRV